MTAIAFELLLTCLTRTACCFLVWNFLVSVYPALRILDFLWYIQVVNSALLNTETSCTFQKHIPLSLKIL